MDPRDTRYRIPPGARSPVTPGSPNAFRPSDWTAPPSTRPLGYSQSTPPPRPSSQTGYDASRPMAMPDPWRSQAQGWSPPRAAQAPNGQNIQYSAQPVVGGYQQSEPWQFPEPQIMRTRSHQATLQPPQALRPRSHSSTGMHPAIGGSASHPNLRHKYSYSDGNPFGEMREQESRRAVERSPSISPSFVSEDFAKMSLGEAADDGLASANGLERFQTGQGDDNDWAWHKLVTKEARESLPVSEVMRQSAMFDLISGERSYVSDLELVEEVFIDGLRRASPPVLPPERLESFLREVFWNMDLILAHHQRMLGSLFNRQQEQHPILLSIGDLVFDTVLKFQTEYESYIKHYPLAESLHRRERKSNHRYRAFLERCSQDPRLGKRDLITFISRPVTRLPRLSLQLVEVKKRTERLGDSVGEGGLAATKEDHPDLETIPIVADVLDSFVKSTQPGIEASEGKVKFYALCESLKYRKGEIIDMDLYNESRTLVQSGPLARKQSETWHGWADLEVNLLDNYLIITKPDTRTGSKDVVSRPIPLEYLRLGPFNGPPDSRREERTEGGGLLDSIIRPTRPMFPLVISHASSPARRYTLYANTDSARQKWKNAFNDALGLRKVVVDANKWFVLDSINDGFFRVRTQLVPGTSLGLFTGRINSAAVFTSGGKNIVVVATPAGVYAGFKGQSGPYVKVLGQTLVSHICVLQGFNKLLVQHDGSLLAYSLDTAVRVALGKTSYKSMDASLERLASPGRSGPVSFFRVGAVAGRTLIVYACKGLMNFTLNALEAVAEQQRSTSRTAPTKSLAFRPYGETFYVPREPCDVTLLVKTIAVCTERSISVVDPTNLTGQPPVPIPDFNQSGGGDNTYQTSMGILKAKCDYAKPIGIVRCAKDELIVIYDEFGCYVTKYGVPTRKCGFVRWETKATAYAERGAHILLFSAQFIEVRHAPTGRLVQVIEGQAIRLSQGQVREPLLISMRGKKDDKNGLSDELVELVETAPIERPPFTPVTSNGPGKNETANPLWDEWE